MDHLVDLIKKKNIYIYPGVDKNNIILRKELNDYYSKNIDSTHAKHANYMQRLNQIHNLYIYIYR